MPGTCRLICCRIVQEEAEHGLVQLDGLREAQQSTMVQERANSTFTAADSFQSFQHKVASGEDPDGILARRHGSFVG